MTDRMILANTANLDGISRELSFSLNSLCQHRQVCFSLT